MLTLFTNFGFFFFVAKVTDGILELKLAIVLDFEGAFHLVTKLHGSEVQVSQWRNSKFAEYSFNRDQDRDLLVFFLLLAFEDEHCDVRILLGLGELLLNLAHKLDVDIDILVGL